MNRKVLLVLVSAMLIAVIVAMVVQSNISSKNKKKEAAVATAEIMVATKDLLKGAVLTDKDVSWKVLPEAAIFTGVVKKPKAGDEKDIKVYNKTILRDIAAGEPINTKALLMDIEGGSDKLSAKLEPGMRAVAVKVKLESTAGGFVSPGDHVDVILTYQLKLKGEITKYTNASQKFASETILKNVRVMAVDQNDKEKGYIAKISKTVTLQVDAEGAQKLNVAQSMGSISLALRRLGEPNTAKDDKLGATTDVMNSEIVRDIIRKMNKEKSQSSTVRIYNGNQITDVPLNAAPISER